MQCYVSYKCFKTIDIPDEILATNNEETIAQYIYHLFPECECVEEIFCPDKNKIFVKDY